MAGGVLAKLCEQLLGAAESPKKDAAFAGMTYAAGGRASICSENYVPATPASGDKCESIASRATAASANLAVTSSTPGS